MGWSSKGDDERKAKQDRDSRRAIRESQARQLAWAERAAKKDPSSKLAQEILRVNRNNI